MKTSIKSKLILLLPIKTVSSPSKRSLVGYCLSPSCWFGSKNVLGLKQEKCFWLETLGPLSEASEDLFPSSLTSVAGQVLEPLLATCEFWACGSERELQLPLSIIPPPLTGALVFTQYFDHLESWYRNKELWFLYLNCQPRVNFFCLFSS